MRIVTAADANRHFSSILREVRDGGTIVVTSRGTAVAQIVPMSERERQEAERLKVERQKAWKEHIARLRAQPAMNIPITWTRDDIYDDDF